MASPENQSILSSVPTVEVADLQVRGMADRFDGQPFVDVMLDDALLVEGAVSTPLESHDAYVEAEAIVEPSSRGRIAELLSNTRVKAASKFAGVTMMTFAVFLTACSNDGENNSTPTTELDRQNGVRAEDFCKAEQWSLSEYKKNIGQAASSPIEAINGDDEEAIKKALSEELGQNNYLLAAADTLIRNNDSAVNVADLEKQTQTTLETIQGDEAKRDKTCEFVIAKFLTEGKRQVLRSHGYEEFIPQYIDGKLNTKETPLTGIDSNDEVSGYAVKRPDGTIGWTITADGRFVIARSIGNEENEATVSPEGDPAFSVDENGNPIQVNPETGEQLPAGQTPVSNGANTSNSNGTGGGGTSSGGGAAGCGTGCEGTGDTGSGTGTGSGSGSGGSGTGTGGSGGGDTTTTEKPYIPPTTPTTVAPKGTLPPSQTSTTLPGGF